MRTTLHHKRRVPSILLVALLLSASSGAAKEEPRGGSHEAPERCVAVLGNALEGSEAAGGEARGPRGERPRPVPLGGRCGVLPGGPAGSLTASAAARRDGTASSTGHRCPWARRLGNANKDPDPFLLS
ncbi:MAG: hypothetical protein ABIK09_02555 [Pseudomonadota bacterium]